MSSRRPVGLGSSPSSDRTGRAQGERADVSGAVAQEWHRLLRERCEDELTLLPFSQRCARCGVDHLDDEVILVHVQSVPRLNAFRRDAWTAHLRQPVEVHSPEPRERGLDLRAQPFCPGLSAEQAELELQRRRIDARVDHGLCDHHRVRGRRNEHLAAQVVQEHGLASRHPTQTGTTGAPIARALRKPWPPVNNPYVFALCTSIPGRTPASVIQRAISSVQASRSAGVSRRPSACRASRSTRARGRAMQPGRAAARTDRRR